MQSQSEKDRLTTQIRESVLDCLGRRGMRGKLYGSFECASCFVLDRVEWNLIVKYPTYI